MTNQHNYLIIGQGKIGSHVSNQLAKLGCQVTGLARKQRTAYNLSTAVDFLQMDAKSVSAEQLNAFTHVAIIVTPSERGEQGYRDSYLAIAEHIASLSTQLTQLQRLIFISSTGVYGQNSGEWIDETTVPIWPERITSRIILQAEQVLQVAFADRSVIIRPSGIYGLDRLMRIRQAKQPDKPPMLQQAWTNRIMDTDLVTIITNVLTMDNPSPIYLATDYQPCTSVELTTWLCEQLDTSAPNTTQDSSIKTVEVKPISGKKIHSNIPLAWLTYPDWQVGYRKIIQSL